jgi:hypothetical protein
MKTYSVVVDHGTFTFNEEVQADYVKLDGGILTFKREVRHTYPEVVRAFAPGRWKEFRLS